MPLEPTCLQQDRAMGRVADKVMQNDAVQVRFLESLRQTLLPVKMGRTIDASHVHQEYGNMFS